MIFMKKISGRIPRLEVLTPTQSYIGAHPTKISCVQLHCKKCILIFPTKCNFFSRSILTISKLYNTAQTLGHRVFVPYGLCNGQIKCDKWHLAKNLVSLGWFVHGFQFDPSLYVAVVWLEKTVFFVAVYTTVSHTLHLFPDNYRSFEYFKKHISWILLCHFYCLIGTGEAVQGSL